MTESHKQIAEDAAHLAVSKAAEAQRAIEEARVAQSGVSDERISRALALALKDVFGENENSGRFIDTSRIPLICQDIKGIHSSIDSIEENLGWIVKLIVGCVVLALLGTVLINK